MNMLPGEIWKYPQSHKPRMTAVALRASGTVMAGVRDRGEWPQREPHRWGISLGSALSL